MAIPGNTFETYKAVGMKEDISNLIFNIAPVETPGLSLAGVTVANQTMHQWQIDDLEDPVAGAASTLGVEGDNPTAAAAEETVMLQNIAQINTRAFSVSGTLEATDKYGRSSELSYQAAKTARFLKNVVDQSITGINQGGSVAATTVARTSASLEAWLTSNTSFGLDAGGTDGADGVLTAGLPAKRTDCTTLRGAFTQAMLDAVIQSAWEAGGKPTTILAGGLQKTTISGFDGVGTSGASGVTRSDRASRTIYATADTYYSNFGILNVIPTRHTRKTLGTGNAEGSVVGEDRNVFCLDPEYLKVAYLRPWQQWDLAKTGDSIQRQMLAEWTLEICNEAAHGGIFDLGTA